MMYASKMTEPEPTCALNIRRFPKELRKQLRMFAIDRGEDLQDFVPRWLRERLTKEREGKPIAKRKTL
jgi:hypothetical protein